MLDERVVGELPDVTELEDRIVRRSDGSYLVDGSVPLRDLPVEVELPEGTVAQLVAARAEGPIGPTTTIEAYGLRLEVVDMDWDRIDKVLVAPTQG